MSPWRVETFVLKEMFYIMINGNNHLIDTLKERDHLSQKSTIGVTYSVAHNNNE